MKYSELKRGQLVYDRWWPWNLGRVLEVQRTRVRVEFSDYECTYDRAHLQFLSRHEKKCP